MYEATRLFPDSPDSDGIRDGPTVNVRELVRREHTCVIATCVAFLDEGLEISPTNQYGQGFRAVEFGPSLPQNQHPFGTTTEQTGIEDGLVTLDVQEKTQKAIEAAYNQGAHVRDT